MPDTGLEDRLWSAHKGWLGRDCTGKLKRVPVHTLPTHRLSLPHKAPCCPSESLTPSPSLTAFKRLGASLVPQSPPHPPAPLHPHSPATALRLGGSPVPQSPPPPPTHPLTHRLEARRPAGEGVQPLVAVVEEGAVHGQPHDGEAAGARQVNGRAPLLNLLADDVPYGVG